MTTELHDPTDDDIRRGVQRLGRHLAARLDDPLDLAPVPPRHQHHHGRSPRPRRVLAAAAVLLAGVGGGVWLSARPDGRSGVTTATTPTTAATTPSTTPALDDGSWPPAPPIHEHCVEDAATTARYGDGYPSQAIREATCETHEHDLLVRVSTPAAVGPGAARSAELFGHAADDEFDAAVAAHATEPGAAEDRDLLAAYRTRRAIVVVGPDGRQVGWWGDGFISLEDLPAAQAAAEATIEAFERTGVRPTTSRPG